MNEVVKKLRVIFAGYLDEVESEYCQGYLQALLDNMDAIERDPVVHETDSVMPPRP